MHPQRAKQRHTMMMMILLWMMEATQALKIPLTIPMRAFLQEWEVPIFFFVVVVVVVVLFFLKGEGERGNGTKRK